MCPKLKKFLLNDEQKFLRGWRSDLGEFETRVLIPSFKGRIENIIDVLKRMKGICAEERKNDILPHLFSALYKNLEIPMPNEDYPENAAKMYLERFDKIIDEDFLLDAEQIRKKFDNEINLNTFVQILIDINNYCHGLIAVKNKTFTFLLTFGGVILDPHGNFIRTVEPKETTFMWYPFNLHYNELCSIAKSTIESVDEWKKTQQKQKESFLNFKSYLTQMRGFRWSVVAAVIFSIAVSWFFFVSTDQLKIRKYEREMNKHEVELARRNEMIEKLQKALAAKKSR